MQSTDSTAHFTLNPKDMDLIISGLGELADSGEYAVDDRRTARDLQGTFHSLTRLWSEWRLTGDLPIGDE